MSQVFMAEVFLEVILNNHVCFNSVFAICLPLIFIRGGLECSHLNFFSPLYELLRSVCFLSPLGFGDLATVPLFLTISSTASTLY